ncbi:MAG: 50S ribosomal protein L9 [Candidatus Zipacnadales bacterium]
MEVILLKDVEALGHEGDIIRVADGHARNYLIPRKLAVQATKSAKQQLERRRGAIARREEQKAATARKVAEQLHQTPLIVRARSGESGKLHGSITAQHIADALAEQMGVTIDRKRINLVEPIREVGDYLVAAELYKGVVAQLTIRVVPMEQAKRVEAGETKKAVASDKQQADEGSLAETNAKGEA